MNWHVHLESTSRDCDGRYDQGSTWTPKDRKGHPYPVGEYVAEWDVEAEVLRYIAQWPGSSYEGPGQITLAVNDEGLKVVSFYMDTEEGFTSTHATICDEDCEPVEARFRDHTAERMGY
jgi:hypothetical protein